MRTSHFNQRHKGQQKKIPVRLRKQCFFFDTYDVVSINFGQLVPDTTPSLTKDEERRAEDNHTIVFWQHSGEDVGTRNSSCVDDLTDKMNDVEEIADRPGRRHSRLSLVSFIG
ncbi:hypothetical protein BLNAU_20125 [Blattamonas nauphoetae]|uniref:Uncharacterized protein n=1 Tax=Blattamonas nauphoetae TaxID=2049346 RepID=A0ABQ9X0S9_9EUKA|nr:hypothetical protein BLNAU_20125 [Blattamonas nauphoetae]